MNLYCDPVSGSVYSIKAGRFLHHRFHVLLEARNHENVFLAHAAPKRGVDVGTVEDIKHGRVVFACCGLLDHGIAILNQIGC